MPFLSKKTQNVTLLMVMSCFIYSLVQMFFGFLYFLKKPAMNWWKKWSIMASGLGGNIM